MTGLKLQAPSSKLQRSSKVQTSNFKLQTPTPKAFGAEKLQAPNFELHELRGGWRSLRSLLFVLKFEVSRQRQVRRLSAKRGRERNIGGRRRRTRRMRKMSRGAGNLRGRVLTWGSLPRIALKEP